MSKNSNSSYDHAHKRLDGLEQRFGVGSRGVGCPHCQDWKEPPYSYEVALASLAPTRPSREEWERERQQSAAEGRELPSYEGLIETLTGRCGKCGRRLPNDIVIQTYDYYRDALGIDIDGADDYVDDVLGGEDDEGETVL